MKPILRARFQHGMTLIELAVGMVIALLVGLAAAGSAQMFTASQRQSMSTGAASMSVASTLTAIKDDVAVAGLGFFGGNRYLCDTLNLSLNNTVVSNGGAFTPLAVTRGAANDTITVVYGEDVAAGANVMLRGDSFGSSAWLRSILPVSLEDGKTPAVLLLKGKGGLCTVRTVTAMLPPDPVAGIGQQLTFDLTGLHNKFVFASMPNYVANEDYVSSIGKLNWHSYTVNADGELVMSRVIDGDTAVLAKDVVAFRVELGVADDGTKPRLDRWMQPQVFGAVTSNNIHLIRAVRMSLTTRTTQAEKPVFDPVSNTEQCMATLEKPKAFPEDADAIAVENSLPDPTKWKCYRYRTASVVVPLRNPVWGIKK